MGARGFNYIYWLNIRVKHVCLSLRSGLASFSLCRAEESTKDETARSADRVILSLIIFYSFLVGTGGFSSGEKAELPVL